MKMFIKKNYILIQIFISAIGLILCIILMLEGDKLSYYGKGLIHGAIITWMILGTIDRINCT